MSVDTLLATQIAFKEWALVCDHVFSGQQVVLLRKGGILEQKIGFQIEHELFLLYPNTEHQSREQIKPEFHDRLATYGPSPKESGKITVSGFCKVVDIIKTADEAKLRALEPFTCWTSALFDMRIRYKPEKPNYIVTVRAYCLPTPVEVSYHADYAGCHSWVPLKNAISLAGAVPVLSDAIFEARRKEILAVVS
jgi:hypothetical protein